MNPTQAEMDRVARQLLATVPEPQSRRPFLFVKRETDFGQIPFIRPEAEPLFKVWIPYAPGDVQRWREEAMRSYPDGCTCPKLPADGTHQTYNLTCPIQGHRRLALAARHRKR